MDFEEFESSVNDNNEPPADMSQELKALWYDAKGNWDKAHELCQGAGTRDGDWVHAHLHRVEGDMFNASHWYHRAGQPKFEGSLTDEWRFIAQELLAR